jgi:HSP20 family protein
MLWSDLERFGLSLDPWRDFESVNRALTGWNAPTSIEFPAVNVWVAENNAVVTSELPGVEPEDIDISVAGKTLTIRGSRKSEELKEGESFHRRERWHGQFTKTLEMPFSIESGKVEAKFVKGVLNIALPRAEAEKPRKISVKSV